MCPLDTLSDCNLDGTLTGLDARHGPTLLPPLAADQLLRRHHL